MYRRLPYVSLMLLAGITENCVDNEVNVYAENRPAKHYVSNVGSIPIIYDGLNQNHISTGTGTGTSPVVEPILTLEDA